MYRFPGGNFLSAHEWRDAIGDPDKRPPRWDPVWSALQPNDVGTDEFLTMCKLLGVDAFISVNAGFGDAHSAAEEVEYVNGAADTRMGKLRAANGHPAPYKVKWWGIGNEMYGTWQFGYMAPKQYVFKHNLFARAMRAVDPTITLLATGATPEEMTVNRLSMALTGKVVPEYGSDADFTGLLLAKCLDNIDVMSEHFYSYNGERFDLEQNKRIPIDEPLPEAAYRAANRVRGKVEAYEEYARRIPALDKKHLTIAIDEWAFTRLPANLKQTLANALVFHEMFRHTDLIRMAGHTMATSSIEFSPTAAALNTTGLLFQLYRDHFGTVPVEVDGNSPPPSPKYPVGGDQPKVNAGSPTYPLDVSAALTPDGRFLTVAVVNPTESVQDLDLTIKGVDLRGAGRVWRMTGSGLDAMTGLTRHEVQVNDTVAARNAQDAPDRAHQYRVVRVREAMNRTRGIHMKILYCTAIALCSSVCLATSTTAPVKVEGGLVQGVSEDNLTVYKGIPFAAPPVGDLRWRAPRPAPPWKEVRKADQFAPGCIPSMGGAPPSGASEDCLYLNIWTPAKSPKDQIPVLVWIYGGGFNAGATSVPVYSGEKLAKRGVVLVSIAYRVGLLGFFAHPELSAESSHHVSGNYGLLDMIAGLQWIQRNIAAFGGDPKRVTIFGESAGGIAVSMLCASPLAKGLFQGAISESGGSFGPFSRTPTPGENMRVLADAEASGAEFAKSANAPTLRALRALAPDRLLEAARRQRGMAWPIVDGWVIPDDQYRLYEAGRFNDTPILVGYNSDEGASFSPGRTPEEYIANVRKRYGPFADRLLQAYPSAAETVPKTARDLMRDSAFGWHTWIWARLQSEHGKGKAYYYYFDQHPEHPAGSPEAGHGSPHGAEIPYVFEHLSDARRPVTAEDRTISDAMAAYWTNFAKCGDPNGEGVPLWPAFSDENPVVMYFAGAPHTGPVPSADSLRVLDSYFAWRRSPDGAVVKAPERRN